MTAVTPFRNGEFHEDGLIFLNDEVLIKSERMIKRNNNA
jgi:hypothetical protein